MRIKNYGIDLSNNKIIYYITWVLVAVSLLIYLVPNMSSIPTVFELPDEAGYLWNAAYFLGIDWNDVGKSGFYGYGYSIFLIPAFILCETGVELIYVANIINMFFLLGIYIVFCILLRNFFNRHTPWIPIIAFVACLTPFLITNTYKVLCEVCLTFFCSLLVLFFYYSIRTRKTIYYLLSLLIAAFIPFIHTRGIVVVGVFFLFHCADFLMRKEIDMKKVFILCGIFAVIFLVLYIVKKYNISYRAQLRIEDGVENNTTNLITSDYFLNRIKRIFDSGILNYVFCFISRFFYSICTTGGMLLLFIPFFKDIKKIIFNSRDNTNGMLYSKKYTMLFVFVCFFITLVACVFNSIGSNIYYVYYGRYYEHTLPILLCFGLYIFINEKEYLKIKYFIIFALTIIVIGIFSCNWLYKYLGNFVYSIDTARLTAFSKAIEINSNNFADVLYFSILISVGIIIICASTYKLNRTKLVAISIICTFLWSINSVGIEEIRNTAKKAEGDYNIVQYIENNVSTQNIYFINDNSYLYDGVKYRMQVLIKNRRVYEVACNNEDECNLEQVSNGDYVITFNTSKIKLDKLGEYTKIIDGSRFILYKKLNN